MQEQHNAEVAHWQHRSSPVTAPLNYIYRLSIKVKKKDRQQFTEMTRTLLCNSKTAPASAACNQLQQNWHQLQQPEVTCNQL